MLFSIVSALAFAAPTVDANALKAVVKKNHGPLNACYEPEAQLNPKLQGDVLIGFTLMPDGSAKKVAVRKTDLKNKNVEDCLVKVFQGLVFPKPVGGGIEINYPLAFAPADVVIETKEGPPRKSGSIAPELIRDTVTAKRDQIQKCFEPEKKKDKKLSGKVVTEFTVELDGHVSEASVKEATLENKPVQDCLVAFIKSLTFPKPEGETNVKITFPFAFQ